MATDPDDDYSPDDAVRRFPSVAVHRITDTEESLQAAMDFDHILAVDPVDLELNSSSAKTLFNYTYAPNDTWIFGPSEDLVVVPLLLSLIGVLALIGNGLVLVSFVTSRRMRTGQNVMIVNVSLADLSFILLAVPVAIVNHSIQTGSGDAFVLGPGLCSFVHYMIFVCFYVAVYTLVVTCVFRFFGEVMRNGGDSAAVPGRTAIGGASSVGGYTGSPASTASIGGVPLSVCNATVSCIVIWVAFLTSHLNFVVNRDGAIFQQPFICHHSTDLLQQIPDPAKLRTLWVTFLACAFLFPLVIVCALSAVILHRQGQPPPPPAMALAHGGGRSYASARDEQYEAVVQNSFNDRRNKRELTVVIMASTVARSLCWLPIQIYLLVDAFASIQPQDDVYRKAEMFGVCFAFAGACINPLIYNWASAEFRHAFRQVFARLGCRRSGVGGGVRPGSPYPGEMVRKPAASSHAGTDLNETIMSIISDSSNHINYA